MAASDVISLGIGSPAGVRAFILFGLTGGTAVAPTITTTTLAAGNVGSYYSRTVVATGDTPITWTVDSGVLPDGLTINSGTGVISGTPTTEETQAFTIKAENAAGSDTQALSITIAAATSGVGIGGSSAIAGMICRVGGLMVH